MLSTAVGSSSFRVVIYENERYSPISGWGSKSLLPTDRKAFSSTDGQDGFASLDEANAALLSRGWMWEPEGNWMIDTGLPNADGDGWSYAADFSTYGDSEKTGSGTKGLIHFVRRRKLIRSQYFDVNTLCEAGEITCDHCDLQEVVKLSELFLIKLVEASLNKHPRMLTGSKVVALKNEMIAILVDFSYNRVKSQSIDSEAAPVSTLARVSSGFRFRRNSDKEANVDTVTVNADNTEGDQLVPTGEKLNATPGWKTAVNEAVEQTYNFETLEILLDQFVERSRTAWSMASSVLKSGDTATNQAERKLQIAQDSFLEEERNELARFVIRRHDHQYLFHCDKQSCGSSCIFAVEQCPNAPCMVCYSRKWASHHDAICPDKILPCQRACGFQIARKVMTHHLQEECPLRPVICPFQCVGCTTALLAKELEGHVQNQVAAHLNLVLLRQLEHQKVISGMYQNMEDLQNEHKRQIALLASIEAAQAAVTAALRVADAKQEKHLQDQINKLDNKLSRQIVGLHGEMQGELGKVRKAVTEISAHK
eukprot:gene1240-1353_t